MSPIPSTNLPSYRTREAAPYWEGLQQGILRYQHCSHCENAIFYPRTFCPYCMSTSAIEWRTSSGLGSLYTYSELFVAPTAADVHRIPYVLGIVEMAEGFYMFGEIVSGERELAIGTAAQAVVAERNGAPLLTFHIVD